MVILLQYLFYFLFLLSYICIISDNEKLMQDNIKYSPSLPTTSDSFFFDHVHITWDKQIHLHQDDSWELSYVITGRGTRIIGDTIEPFTQGEVILIPPNIPHCWSFDESVYDDTGKIENITITFTNKLLENCCLTFSELSDIVVRIQENSDAISFSGDTLLKLQKAMVSMVAETRSEKVSSLIKLFNIIAFPEAKNVVGRPVVEDKKTKKMQNIYLYVMNNYQHNITLDEVAEFVGMERSSFCVFFRKMTNKPFFSFLTEYRIESSCQMLSKTTKTISEICIASGFRDIPYYNRVFKKIKQVTPSEYRKHIAQT